MLRRGAPGFHGAKVAQSLRRVQHRVSLHRRTRSQKSRISVVEIRVLRSAALAFTAGSRSLARNAPGC